MADRDWFKGWSIRGGDRNPANGAWIGPTDTGAFWRGADGNVYVQGANGINSAGKWDNNTEAYWTKKGFYRTPDSKIAGHQTNTTGGEQQTPDYVGGYGGGYGGGYSQAEARAKADAISRYDEAIRTAQDGINRLAGQEAAGVHNIEQDINNQRNDLNTNFNRSKGMYEMNTKDTITNNRNTRDQIAENAREQTRGARQMFAAGGAGDSSWSKILAPFAVGKAATKQQSAVQDAYAKNRRDLDINYDAVRNAYNDNKRKLDRTREDRINSLRASVLQSRNDLENKIREANIGKSQANGQSLQQAIAATEGARNAINARSNEITNLSRSAAVPLESVAWKAPTLDTYADKAKGISINTNNPDQAGLQDQLNPNLQALLDPEKKKRESGEW